MFKRKRIFVSLNRTAMITTQILIFNRTPAPATRFIAVTKGGAGTIGFLK